MIVVLRPQMVYVVLFPITVVESPDLVRAHDGKNSDVTFLHIINKEFIYSAL